MADINVSVMGVKAPGPHGRVDIDVLEPGRRALIEAGKAALAVNQILVLDASGDPSKISKADNDRTDNVGWDVKVIGGVNETEHTATYTIGKVGDDKIDKSGDARVPFEGIREGVDAERHYNVAHFRYHEGLRGQAFFRQWRESAGLGRHFSDWLGPILIGSQA